MNDESIIAHEPHHSLLNKRQPSREDNERLRPFHNTYLAANIRRTIPIDDVDTYYEAIQFSWPQFWKALIYETLPPVFLSPLAAFVLEKNSEAALHTIEHRGLLALSTRYRSLGGIIGTWLILYPVSILIPVALVLRMLNVGMVRNVDFFLILLAYFFCFLRNLIIAIKYGYTRPEEVDELTKAPEEVNKESGERRMIYVGWRNPSMFPGLIEDELTCSMDENDLSLQAMSFHVNPDTASQLRRQPTSELFPAATSYNEHHEVAAGFVLHQIIKRAYALPFPKIYRLLTRSIPTIFALIPVFIRWQYELPLFGESWLEIFVSGAAFIGILFSGNILIFGWISAHDFKRRQIAMELLGKIIQYPGIPLSTLIKTPEGSDPPLNGHLFIDLQEPNNVFSWMNCRQVMRSFGESYYLRIQSYTSVLLSYAFLSVITLNIIAWIGMRHHISTIILIFVIIIGISAISFASITKATKLQSLSRIHRGVVKKNILSLERMLMETQVSDKERYEKIKSAKSMLSEVDEAIHFQEEIHKPTRVMGQAATQNVINSTLGILAAGLIFAVEGFSGANFNYDVNGWFGF